MKGIIFLILMILMSFNIFARTASTDQPGLKFFTLKTEDGTFSKSVTIGASSCVTISATTALNITATAVFTFGSHEFETADKVRMTSDNTLPTNADADTDYYVYDLSANTFQLATTKAKAIAANPDVTFTSTGLGTHKVCLNEFKYTDHGFVENERVQVTTTGTMPTGFAASTDYWIDKVDSDTFNIKSLYGLNVPVEWTDTVTDNTATGTFTITRTDDFAGLSKYNLTITATETGVYLIDRTTAFANADQTAAFVSPITDDCHARILSQTATRVIINTVDATDGTTEKDCNYNLLIFGSSFPDSYNE